MVKLNCSKRTKEKKVLVVNDNQEKFILKALLKQNPDDILIDKNKLLKMIDETNDTIKKQNKCKLCNKKYTANNRMYGSSCLNNLYKYSKVERFKGIDDEELYLCNVVAIRLGKTDTNGEKIGYVCESYFSKKLFDNVKYIKSDIIDNEIKWCIENDRKPIMKLNTAYRVSNILKRNKKKLIILTDSDKDKLIDTVILQFFKTYFRKLKSVKKIDYQVYYYIQLVFWEFIVANGIFVDYQLSAKLLSHSLTGIDIKPKNLLINDPYEDEDIINIFKNDVGFKKKIKTILDKYGKNNIIDFNSKTVENASECYYTFTSGDLAFSLHNVSLTVKGNKINNLWQLEITIADRYDFTELLANDIFTKKTKKYGYMGKTLNDFAAISSEYGVIKPYDVTISFKWNDFN